ncbi:MAG: hypothetical protein DMF77_18720 [Acidobacteria bacterium]|nr:MAG: hypothetical protein DMF77_18720 [Acidobacteriota bacterium]
MVAAGARPRYETVDGLRLRYVRKGSGPPLVLLHGLGSSVYTWKYVWPTLAAHHDVIAMDLPGFGGSAVPERPKGETTMRSVVGLMDRLGIARASLVGNSLGGAIAVAVAARAPGRVDRLVLIDGAGYNFALADRPFVLRLAAGVPAPFAEVLPLRPLVTLALRQVRRPGAAAALNRLLVAPDELGFPEVIRRVQAPTLIIWGRYDEWIPSRDAARFAADIPGARVVFVDAGHMPQEERPQETAALIEEFLQGRGTVAARAVSNP